MQSLLRWGIEHSTDGDGVQQNQSQPSEQGERKLDPEIIDMILGKPDSQLMKEQLAIAVDEKRSEDERVDALDNFEMLIESIDNANDLEKLNMWKPLQDLLTSPSSTDNIKRQVLWVMGTAVQNNPTAQRAFLSMSPIPTLLSFLSASTPPQTRSKAVYTLSGILKHNATAVHQLDAAGGWDILRSALEDSDINVRRKTAFLLNALLIPSTSSHPAPQPASNPSYPPPPPSSTPSTALTLHSPPPSSGPALHTPDAPSAPVHPNSHASMLSDPSSMDTSTLALKALWEKGLMGSLVRALVDPVPHGEDGDVDGDVDFEEKVIRLLYTYVTACRGQFPDEEKKLLKEFWIREGENQERWGLSEEEMRMLLRAVQ